MSDLIDNLRKLHPTPAPWEWLGRDQRPQGKLIHIPADAIGFSYTTVADADTFMDFEPQLFISCENADDAKLLELAPAMRDELLKTADALAKSEAENAALKARAERLEHEIARAIDSIERGFLLRKEPETYRNGCVAAFKTIGEILKRDNEAQS